MIIFVLVYVSLITLIFERFWKKRFPSRTNIISIIMTGGRPIVHILGMGSMGSITVLSLLENTSCEIIPLFRDEAKLNRFQNSNNSQITVRKLDVEGQPVFTKTLEKCLCPTTIPENYIIENLIITTKTYQTPAALKPYLPYLTDNSNLIFIQNGLGVLDKSGRPKDFDFSMFDRLETMNNLFQGVISHGAYQVSEFEFNFACNVGLKISRIYLDTSKLVQSNELVAEDAEKNELVNLFTQPAMKLDFQVTHLTYQELLMGQIQKFFLNICINPVTAIIDCLNGGCKNNSEELFTSIIEEALYILRITFKPLFEYEKYYNNKDNYPTLAVNETFIASEMAKWVIGLACHIGGKNSSSMRQDTINCRDTEIDDINGFLVRTAKRLNLPAEKYKVNNTIIQLVNLRLNVNRTRAGLNK